MKSCFISYRIFVPSYKLGYVSEPSRAHAFCVYSGSSARKSCSETHSSSPRTTSHSRATAVPVGIEPSMDDVGIEPSPAVWEYSCSRVDIASRNLWYIHLATDNVDGNQASILSQGGPRNVDIEQYQYQKRIRYPQTFLCVFFLEKGNNARTSTRLFFRVSHGVLQATVPWL